MPLNAKIPAQYVRVPAFQFAIGAVVPMVKSVLPVAERDCGVNVHLLAAGKPEQLKPTVPAKPSRSVINTDIDDDDPGAVTSKAFVEV